MELWAPAAMYAVEFEFQMKLYFPIHEIVIFIS